jgi:hypothetical protein
MKRFESNFREVLANDIQRRVPLTARSLHGRSCLPPIAHAMLV